MIKMIMSVDLATLWLIVCYVGAVVLGVCWLSLSWLVSDEEEK